MAVDYKAVYGIRLLSLPIMASYVGLKVIIQENIFGIVPGINGVLLLYSYVLVSEVLDVCLSFSKI